MSSEISNDSATALCLEERHEVIEVALLTRNTEKENRCEVGDSDVRHPRLINDCFGLLSHSLLFSDLLRECFGRIQNLVIKFSKI